MFFRTIDLPVHQAVHALSLPLGIWERSDRLCWCALDLRSGKWSDFGYLPADKEDIDRISEERHGKWVQFYSVVGFLIGRILNLSVSTL